MKSATLPKKSESDKVYQKFVKPLEKDHWGKFVAVSSKGKTILTDSLLEAVQKGISILGSGNFVFKVGEKAVGRIGKLKKHNG